MERNQHKQKTLVSELDAVAAYLLASRLVLIPRFPRDRAAIELVAEWLMELCCGAKVDGQPWTASEQVTWLIDTAAQEFENWDEGKGLPGIRAIFNRKFKPPPALVEYEMLPAPTIDCKDCNDNGIVEHDGRIHWCSCDQARQLLLEAPNLVATMNRPRERREADQARRREIEAEVTRRLAERKRDAETDHTTPGAMPLVRRPRLFGVLNDWAGRILRKCISARCGWKR